MIGNEKHVQQAVPPGGPATINGVLYQMLWSLLRASRARFVGRPCIQGDQVQEATIVLEPIGGGGDLVVQGARRRCVEQIKARPDGGTWSYREVIETVIPDLYLAVDGDPSETEYRFVTEGRMGQWVDVYRFFGSLRHRACPEGDPLSDLDDLARLKCGSKRAGEVKTESAVFKEVVAELRKRESIRENEDEETTQKKLRTVLAHFEFVGGQEAQMVQQEIDSHLMTIIARNDDLPQIRDSLAFDLARRATGGSAEISVVEFFQDHGLNAIPLTDWGTLRAAAHRLAQARLHLRGYEPDLDVRRTSAERTLNEWRTTAPMLAITGESGRGKSWRAYAMVLAVQNREPLSVVVDAGSSVDGTLDRISAAVWHDIAGHDAAIPLSQIAQRVRQIVGERVSPWLTVFLDGVIGLDQADELMRHQWEDWGVRLVMTVSLRIASSLETRSQGRCAVVRLEDFTHGELHSYLDSFLPDAWPSMPDFVRNPLRRPLMASIYRQIVEPLPQQSWSPRSEYEVFAAFWGRILEREPMDRLVLLRLAERFLRGDPYPWPDYDVDESHGSNDVIRRLEELGWLRMATGPTGATFEVPHARLLNWACAHALFAGFKRGTISSDSLCSDLKDFLGGRSPQHADRLGFVPMDFLWLMCQDEQLRGRIPEILAGLEANYRHNDILYKKLIPSLGPSVIEALATRLREAIDDMILSRMIEGAIQAIGGAEAFDAAVSMLDDENPLLQRAACTILQKCPTPEALDRLWRLHNAAQADPTRFLRQQERASRYLLYDEVFPALRECCRLAPDWLNRAIRICGPETEVVADLAYLLANLECAVGAEIWQTHKRTLFERVPAEKRRSLATCIDRFSDRDEIPWLISSIGESRDVLGAKAFTALARLAPEEAVRHLDRVPTRELVMARHWFIDYLFAVAADATREKLRKMMAETADVWDIAEVYHGRLHYMDEATLEFLLRDLQDKVSQVLSEPDGKDKEPLWGPLQLLSDVNAKELVEHLGRWRDTHLEAGLCQMIQRIGPRQGIDTDSLVRKKILDLLYRINGEGFSEAVNVLLRAESRYGRLDGLDLAGKRPNAETFRLLSAICEQAETWDGHPIEQCHAAEILGEHGVWEAVLALVRRIGMQVTVDVTNLPRSGRRHPEELLGDVSEAVKSAPSLASAGDVVVLGFGGHEQAGIVRSVACCCDPASDVAHACVVALEMLEDEDEGSVPFLRRQLDIPTHNFSATNALIVNGTQRALEALADHAGDQVEGAVAINLVNRLADPSMAIRRTKDHAISLIERNRGWRMDHDLCSVIQCIQHPEVVTEILAHPAIEDHLRAESFADEGNAWFTGSKASAIRCLGRLDRRAAFVAAKSALRNIESHDRDCYPPILAGLDSDAANEVLFDMLRTEESDAVRESIGRTLSTLNVMDAVLSGMRAEDARSRSVACYVAGWLKGSEEITERLIDRLLDADDSVAETAAKAIARSSRHRESEKLGQAILDARTSALRWLYFDCLLALADPGDQHRPWPVNGPDIGAVLSPLQRKYGLKRLKDKRKELNAKTSSQRL